MAVVPIRKAAEAPATKRVAASQKAVDDVPFDSGDWKIDGVPGLYLRAKKQSKSYFIHRRVGGELVKETLGQVSVKDAKAKAMKRWSAMKPTPPAAGVVTLTLAFEEYIENKLDRRGQALAPKTKDLYRYNFDRYLGAWKGRSMDAVGKDREGVRLLQSSITRKHGRATANQVVRLLSAVYRRRRDIDTELPEPPTTAVKTYDIEARDWALSDAEIRRWWAHEVKAPDGQKTVARGVSAVGPIKRTWWLAALYTGARKGSIEALKWTDLDFEAKTVRFAVTKGDRPYRIPMSDKLCSLLKAYRESGDVPPSEWVFPSSVKAGEHIVGVKDDKSGVPPAHRLRHTYRTVLAQLGATPDQARLLLGHSRGKDVSANYITDRLVIESLRPVVNAVAEYYSKVLGW